MPDRRQVVLRIDKGLVKRVDLLAVEWDVFRSEAFMRLLEIAFVHVDAEGKVKH